MFVSFTEFLMLLITSIVTKLWKAGDRLANFSCRFGISTSELVNIQYAKNNKEMLYHLFVNQYLKFRRVYAH